MKIVSASFFYHDRMSIVLSNQRYTEEPGTGRNATKVDQNVLYGMYYDDNGHRIDQRVNEVVDTNDDYGLG